MVFHRLHPRERERQQRAVIDARMGGFHPSQSSKVGRWYRLSSSTPVSAEWETVVEVFGGNSVTQTAGVRKPAVGASSNGLPVAVFDGSDLLVMPLDAAGSGNNSLTKCGLWFTFRPASVAGMQRLFRIAAIAGGANLNKLEVYANNATLAAEAYITNTTGRVLTTGNVLSAGTRVSIYLQYDSSRGGDDNMRIYVDAVNAGGSYTNIGAGGTLTTLQSAAGNAFIGAATDADAPVQAIQNGGEWGDNTYVLIDNLTDTEMANFHAFERAD